MREVFSWALFSSMPAPKGVQTWEKKMREMAVGWKRMEGVANICQKVGQRASLSEK